MGVVGSTQRIDSLAYIALPNMFSNLGQYGTGNALPSPEGCGWKQEIERGKKERLMMNDDDNE